MTEKMLWPAVRYAPNGDKATFMGPDEVPEGWRDHPFASKPQLDHDENGQEGGSVSGGSGETIQALRAAYKAKYGKKPFGAWDVAKLKEKLV